MSHRTAARLHRRALLATPFLARTARAEAAAHVVVIGGGFGGVSAARAMRRAGLRVSILTGGDTYAACPMSSEVIAGMRPMEAQRFGYAALEAEGIGVVRRPAFTVAPQARLVTFDRAALRYDRLVIAPGITPIWDAIRGYDAAAAQRMPHAWQAGAQTIALRDALARLKPRGLVVVAAPAAPYRCPPAPYERASLIAHAIRRRGQGGKVLVLDAKDRFSQQALFREAWDALYPGIIEWVGLDDGGRVVAVDAAAGTVTTDFETYRPDVANIIPPQRAADIARLAGVADFTGWCPVNAATFESLLVPGIHVIGDAALAGAISKSAFAAVAEGEHVAAVIAAELAGRAPPPPALHSACFSTVAPDWAFTLVTRYRLDGGLLLEDEAVATPPGAPAAERAANAAAAGHWFSDATRALFG